MLRFIVTRAALIIPTFIGVTLLAFAMIRLVPGDPIELLAGERGISAERHAKLMAEYGFDKPLLVQYAVYVAEVLQGDLGQSISTRQPVLEEFAALFPATVELSFCAMLFAMVLGLPAGIVAALKRGTRRLKLPQKVSEMLSPIPYIIPAQLFAALLAQAKGLNPDVSRSLSKVTKTV